MAEQKNEIRYSVKRPLPWNDDSRPELVTETWIRGAKKAKLLEPGRGYSMHDHDVLDARARTPGAALALYLQTESAERDRIARKLLMLEERVAQAIRAKIIDGKLVL